jgi:hypothetical protein
VVVVVEVMMMILLLLLVIMVPLREARKTVCLVPGRLQNVRPGLGEGRLEGSLRRGGL